jgi:hypothetical protein
MTTKEKEIFEILKTVALEDGIMKLDETKIISHAMRTAITFDWYLEEAMKDGVIDEAEKAKLDQLKQRIYDESKKIAEQDALISRDEAKLLARLSEKLESLHDYEEDHH